MGRTVDTAPQCLYKDALYLLPYRSLVEFSWNVMAHSNAREGKWSGKWRMQWVASTLHTTSEHGVSSITIADAHSSAASSRMVQMDSSVLPKDEKFGFCVCDITFQLASTNYNVPRDATTFCFLFISSS